MSDNGDGIPKPRTDPRRPNRATTFTQKEIEAVYQVGQILFRGGDPRIIARSGPFQSAHAKFARMRSSLEQVKS